jgi:hypothetical protein
VCNFKIKKQTHKNIVKLTLNKMYNLKKQFISKNVYIAYNTFVTYSITFNMYVKIYLISVVKQTQTKNIALKHFLINLN